MGIALPKWIVEGKNNIWVLGFYGLVFGGALPALVVRILCLLVLALSFSYSLFSRVGGGSVAVKRPKTESMHAQQPLSLSL